MSTHFREGTVGDGTIDFAAYLNRAAALPTDAPLMIEHMANAEEYDKARRRLLDLGAKTGIDFGN